MSSMRSGNDGMSGDSARHASSNIWQNSPDAESDEDFSEEPTLGDPGFDVLDWHAAHQSCQKYFLDHAQHEPATQAVCALINIRLPFQRLDHPILTYQAWPSSPQPSSAGGSNSTAFARSNTTHPPSPGHLRGLQQTLTPPVFVSVVPYIRRLVVTNFDKAAILHGFFGDDYVKGIMPHVQCERRNYLFAAKHGGWRSCKKQYDTGSGGGSDESVPFMKPLDDTRADELHAAERAWSDWLAMEDWMVGPDAPNGKGNKGVRRHRASGDDPMLDSRDLRDLSRRG